MGDELLRGVSRILEKTFRDTDVIGRLGGDEFAVLTIDAADENGEAPLARLAKMVDEENRLDSSWCGVHLSVGFSTATPTSGRKLEELVREADQRMQTEKLRRRLDAGGLSRRSDPLG